MSNKRRPNNIFLVPIFEDIVRLLDCFHIVSFQHVYHERNMEADHISKKGLSIDEGIWHRWEKTEEDEYAWDHGPFMSIPL